MLASHRMPVIFIQRDPVGLREEEVLQARKYLKNLQFGTELAKLVANGHLVLSESAGDVDEEWLSNL